MMIIIDGKHEYDYEVNNNIYTLKYSDNDYWTYPKKVAMQVVDDANGLVVQFDDEGRINYSEAEKLLILLKMIDRNTKYEVVTNKELL